jgi:hypothetical protein
MRVCAVSLPELRIELVRAEMASGGDAGSLRAGLPRRARQAPPTLDPHAPLAVVVAPLVQGEALLTEQKLLGNTRLSVVSREARALGVLPGHTIAQARARAGDLAVRVVRPDAVRDVLARLAEVGLAYGATVSFGMEGQASFQRTKRQENARRTGAEASGVKDTFQPGGAFGDVVWIDVTGCAHLHEPKSIFDGETILATRLARVIASLGHTCSVAIADGPRVAAMLARAMFQPSSSRSRSAARSRTAMASAIYLDPVIVRPGENERALASLPVSALPLPPEDVRWLAKIGVRTIGELRDLPQEGLGTRLGAHAREVLSLAAGDDRAPLAPYVPPEIPEEDVELEYGIDGTQALTFVAKTLTDRLSARLQGRAVAASRVELELHLDAAMLETKARRTPREIVGLDLPAPLSGASDLLAALRPKIERVVLDAPVLRAKLRAPVLVHQRALALSLFEPEPKAERALPRLVGELVSDLGADRVSTLVLGDSWSPEDRSLLVPFGRADANSAKKKRRHMLSSVPEPTRLLPESRVVSRESVRVTRQLSRLEAVEWWKTLPSARGTSGSSSSNGARSPHLARVDYVQAWTDDGEAWVEIDRASGTTRIRGWFD